MLVHLSVHNYAIVEHLDLELDRGMSVITGETGAGKSIMLDALGLALGDRADSGVVRPGADKADILASFDLAAIPDAVFSLNQLWDLMIAEGRAFGITHPGGWCDLGRPETIPLAEAMLAEDVV